MAANEHSRPAQRRWMFVCVHCVACAMHVYVAAVAEPEASAAQMAVCVCVACAVHVCVAAVAGQRRQWSVAQKDFCVACAVQCVCARRPQSQRR